jgi:hypothetical protein
MYSPPLVPQADKTKLSKQAEKSTDGFRSLTIIFAISKTVLE